VLMAPVAEPLSPTVLPPVMVPTPQPSAAATGVVESVLAPITGNGPVAPVESAVSWVMLAAARRELGTPAAGQHTPATAVPTGPLSGTDAVSNRTAERSAIPASAAAEGAAQIIDPVASATATNPIAAFFEQIGAFVNQIVTAIAQVITQVVTAITNIFNPAPANKVPVAAAPPIVGTPDAATGVVTGTVTATDPDGDTVTYSAPATTAKGTVVVDATTGEFVYTPTAAARHDAASLTATGAQKADTFIVTVTDERGGKATISVAVVISPSNAAPVAGTPSLGAPDSETGVVTGSVSATDADGDTLTFSGSTTTAKGAVVVNADGAFFYTPTQTARHAAARDGAEAADLADSFTISMVDGHGGSATAAVNVVISPSNAAPVAEIVSISAPDSSTGAIAGVMEVLDADGDTITYSVPVATAKGEITFDPDGTFTYTPTAAARHDASKEGADAAALADSFTVTVFDGYGGSASAVVNVAVSPVNAAPVAGTPSVGDPDSETGVVTGSVSATDSDGDSLSFDAPASTSKGSVSINASTGAFTYTPTATARQNAAASGATSADEADTFTVTVSDGYGGSTLVPVNVVVSPTPQSNRVPVVGTLTIGTPNASTGVVTGSVAATDADGDPLTYTGSTTTSKGAVIVAADGSFAYTPTVTARHAAAKTGATASDQTDSFVVTVSDGNGGIVTIPASVAVSPSNAAPVAGTPTVGSPNATTGVVTGTVTAADADGDTPIYSGSTTTSKGTVVVNANGGFTYTPTATARHAAARDGAEAADLVDTFTVIVADGYGGSVAIQVGVAIGPSNDAPVAGIPVVGTPEAGTGQVTGSVSATDPDGDSLTYSGSTTTSKGSFMVAANGGFTYTPTYEASHNAAALDATDAERTASFTVTVADGYGGTATIPVIVWVGPGNATPVVGALVVGTPDASTGVVTGQINATDPDGDTLTYSGSTSTRRGTVVVNADGSFTYTPTTTARHDAANTTPTPTTDVLDVIDGFSMPSALALSPDGSRLYVADQGTQSLVVVATATNTTVASIPGMNAPTNVAVSPDGTRVYVADLGGYVSVIDTATNTISGTVTGLSSAGAMAFSPSGTRAYIVDPIAAGVSVVSVASNSVVDTINIGGTPTGVAVSLDGSRVYVTETGGMSVVDTDTNTVLATVAGFANLRGVPGVVAVSPDGTEAYIGNGTGAVWVVDTGSYAVSPRIGTAPSNFLASSLMALSAEGRYVFVNAGTVVSVIDTTTQTVVADVTDVLYPAGVVVNSVGTRLYVTSVDGTVVVIDTMADSSDHFNVTVSDGHGGTATVPVSVTVSPSNTNPVAGTPVVGTPDAANGVVTGSVSATDADGDTPTYSGSTTTSKGAVVVNADGSFTYTPTVTARHAAARTAGDLTDAFTVTVVDGYGGSASVPVTVAIKPLNPITATIPVGENPRGIALSPNGTRLYITNLSSNSVSVIDTVTNNVVATIPVGDSSFNGVYAVAVSPDGSRAYVANNTPYGVAKVFVVDTATNTVTGTISGPPDPNYLTALAFSPDGTRVYASGTTTAYTGTLSVITTATNTLSVVFDGLAAPRGLAVSPDGTYIYVGTEDGMTGRTAVSVIDSTTFAVTAKVTVGRYPSGLAVSPDGSRLYVTSAVSNAVSVIDTSTNTVSTIIGGFSHPVGVAVSPDGAIVYVANHQGNSVSEIDAATNSVIATVSVGNGPWAVRVSPDGNFVYVTNINDDTVSVIHTGR